MSASAHRAETHRTLGPHSRRIALGMLDGRRREARLMRGVVAELSAHCGGAPSAVQLAIIHQAAQIKLRLLMMDARFAETGEVSERDSRCYLAHANSCSRLLRQLGLKGAAERAPSLAELLAQPYAPPTSEAPTPAAAHAATSSPPTAVPPHSTPTAAATEAA
jgi:hypothetical protein